MTAGPAGSRTRRVETRPFPRRRKLVTEALRTGRRMSPVHGILQIDVTNARRRMAAHEPPLSMTAFVVASVGRAAANHPEVHAYRDWRGRLVVHRHVDVATMIEVRSGEGSIPIAHLVSDADRRIVADISSEIRGVYHDPQTSPSGRVLTRGVLWASFIPGALGLVYRVLGKSVRLRQKTGTVSVTSVGMFAGGGGAGIAQPTLLTLGVLVGGVSSRPAVIEGEVCVRDVMDLTITVDHNVVDGAPAARFAAELRELLEEASVLGED